LVAVQVICYKPNAKLGVQLEIVGYEYDVLPTEISSLVIQFLSTNAPQKTTLL
jgi:hypothetical protein